uniref:Uncharacterized protein n=1 Tax=Arundo donax TaxID=35708 RepID=A0A0A8ZXX7_ARUDO
MYIVNFSSQQSPVYGSFRGNLLTSYLLSASINFKTFTSGLQCE